MFTLWYCNVGWEFIRSRMDSVDGETLDKLEDGFKLLRNSDSKSLLKKYLTQDVFENLKNKKTSYGSTLLDCIQSGLKNLDSGVGIYAPDSESYRVFAELFDPIIEDYHKGFGKNDVHPAPYFGDPNDFGTLDIEGKLVISTRIRVGRSMKGYPFNPCLTEQQYKEMEQIATKALSNLPGDLAGQFYPLTGMSKDVQQRLIDDHFLFKEGDRFLEAANANRFWPTGRGIFHNEQKSFLVWVNEEDHLRVISMQMGGNVCEIYSRLLRGLNEIENKIPFAHDDRLGYLTFCPTNLGTTIRASVLIRIPKLLAKKDVLDDISKRHNLQVRGTRGEHSSAEGGIVDVSNKRRMGLTEYQAVKEMYEGVSEIISKEYELMKK
ncbi:arginine kinase isoform X2 [Planococcus citri]|uniref:arginine kinase isoform X2 n=1 Tax=Planococcus citri TaxID=170843 RepID=UPI0031FA0C9D